jgi:hypothetical protein
VPTASSAPATPQQKKRPAGRAVAADAIGIEARSSPASPSPPRAHRKAPGNGAAIGGIKVVSSKSGWFAARPSGTEEIYKIYAESFDGRGRGEAHLKEPAAHRRGAADRAAAVLLALFLGALVFLRAARRVAARVGGASMLIGALRIGFWGALAMAVTAGVGTLLGTVSGEHGMHSKPNKT